LKYVPINFVILVISLISVTESKGLQNSDGKTSSTIGICSLEKLSNNWVQCELPNGKVYFYNKNDGSSSWHAPPPSTTMQKHTDDCKSDGPAKKKKKSQIHKLGFSNTHLRIPI